MECLSNSSGEIITCQFLCLLKDWQVGICYIDGSIRHCRYSFCEKVAEGISLIVYLCLCFLLFIEYDAHMRHFASYFLAQQLNSCVHAFSFIVGKSYVPLGHNNNLSVE